MPAPGASLPILGAWIGAYRFVYDSVGTIDDGVRKVSSPQPAKPPNLI